MKISSLLFIISIYVNGSVTDDTESVSVMSGDSVTLHINMALQADDLIEWRFGAQLDLIAKLNREANGISLSNTIERFTDRHKMSNRTGDLTITNITSQHAGLYQLEITGNKVTIKRFTVTGVFDEEDKLVSAMEGDSVTFNPDVADIKTYDVIRWTFQHGNSFLAELDRKTSVHPKYGVLDGRFRDRLQLHPTGSLTIRNIRFKHSGLYEVDIISSTHTIHQSVNVTVKGEGKLVSVKEEESVILQTHLTRIQKNDKLEWWFGTRDTPIVYTEKDANGTSVYCPDLDERFRDRLKVDDKTGDLTILNIGTDLSGLYELKIINSRRSIHRRCIVTVSPLGLSSRVIASICVAVLLVVAAAGAAVVFSIRRWFPKARALKVSEGDRVILHTDYNMHFNDVIQWRFGLPKTPIAELRITPERNYEDRFDGRFRDRLTLSRESGSLTINDTRTTDSGVYRLKITSSSETSYKRFRLTVSSTQQQILVNEGESVTLNTDKTTIETDEKMKWMFGDQDTIIAHIGHACNIPSTFPENMLLDTRTGCLTIKNITLQQCGVYKLETVTNDKTSYRRFNVSLIESNRVDDREPFMNGADHQP